MRNRRQISNQEYLKIQKLKEVSTQINRNQVLKILISVAIIIPVLLLLGGHLSFLSIEVTLGYFAFQLVALNYYYLQDWRLSSVRHKLMIELRAQASETSSNEFISTIRNGVRLSNYGRKFAPIG